MKSEPYEFHIDDFAALPNQTVAWEGIRNYQARNFMRHQMAISDQVLFYHSCCKDPGIVGIAEVCSGAYPDHTAFDPNDKHFDPKSDPDNPRWMMVDIRYKDDLKRAIPLSEIRQYAERLEGFALIRRGNRLSVMPVEKDHFEFILGLQDQPAP